MKLGFHKAVPDGAVRNNARRILKGSAGRAERAADSGRVTGQFTTTRFGPEGADLAAGADHVRVLLADLVDAGVLVEVPHGVPAQEREVVRHRQLVPQHLEAHGRDGVTVLPEQIDHLAVRANRAVGAPTADFFNRCRHAVFEPLPVGHAVHHERGHGFAGVQQEEVARRLHSVDVEMAGAQFLHDGGAVLGRANHQARLAGDESGAEKFGDYPTKRLLTVVKPDCVEMPGRARVMRLLNPCLDSVPSVTDRQARYMPDYRDSTCGRQRGRQGWSECCT